jgi:hypothetical protein
MPPEAAQTLKYNLAVRMRSIFLGSLTLLLPVWTWHVSWGAVYVALKTQNKTLAFYSRSSTHFTVNRILLIICEQAF